MNIAQKLGRAMAVIAEVARIYKKYGTSVRVHSLGNETSLRMRLENSQRWQAARRVRKESP